MAFQQSTGNNAVNPFAGQQSQPAHWKADGFINLYLPTKEGEGKRRKLGSIPLKASRKAEADLVKWLNEDPSRVVRLLEKMEIDYKSSEGSEDSAFDLD